MTLFRRQLEAIIRVTESLAKMELQPFVTDRHVDEALRLFKVSTLEAAAANALAGMLFSILSTLTVAEIYECR